MKGHGMLLLAKPKSIEIQAKLFRGFSDPSRLSILDALRNRALTVGEIVEATGLAQSNVSNHLACLRDCGLVTAEQHGRFVSYELSDERVGQLLTLADELLADVAKGVYECTRYNVKVSKNGTFTNS
jgi:ArsR family transcriptional regulator, cadmium/lead-responsive transcriptional repressor